MTRKFDFSIIVGMGKAFVSELEKLAETCRYTSAIPVDDLRRFVSKALFGPITAVGVGGSFSAACFATTLFDSQKSPALAKTTFDFCTSNATLTGSSVLLLSASGRNKDILAAFETANLGEAQAIFSLCARTGSRLRQSSENFWETEFLDFDLPAGNDGFLATNSLLASVLLLAKAFEPDKWTDQAFFRIEKECVRPFAPILKLAKKKSLMVLYGKWSHMAAVDIESKCSEAALAGVQLCDYRSFAHGRHNWIAKRSAETLVVPLISKDDQALASRTLKLLPRTTDIFPLEVNTMGSEAAVQLLVRAIKFIGALGQSRSVDPGRPGIPPFGSRVYNLKAFPTGRIFRASLNDCKKMAVHRKIVAGAFRQQLGQAAADAIEKLEAARYGAVIFDFDGTLCSSKDRLHGVSRSLQPVLIKFLKQGVVLGIATGRGKSARTALQTFIPQNFWKQVIIGYYNGSAISTLDDESTPDKNAVLDSDIGQMAAVLSSLPEFEDICELDVRAHQITLRSKRLGYWREVSRTARELIAISGARLKLLESSHSLDIVSSSASKVHVVERIRSTLPSNRSILCIGDRGDIAGNDHALLSTPFSLSSHLVSSSRDVCWNLAPPGLRCAQGTLFYLNCMKTHHKTISFSMEEGLRWLNRHE